MMSIEDARKKYALLSKERRAEKRRLSRKVIVFEPDISTNTPYFSYNVFPHTIFINTASNVWKDRETREYYLSISGHAMSHETLHNVLNKIRNLPASRKLDALLYLGNPHIDYTGLPVPEDPKEWVRISKRVRA